MYLVAARRHGDGGPRGGRPEPPGGGRPFGVDEPMSGRGQYDAAALVSQGMGPGPSA